MTTAEVEAPPRPVRAEEPVTRTAAARRHWPVPALAAIVLVGTVVLAHYGLRVHTFQPDEWLNRTGARYLQQDFWHHIFSLQFIDRGPDRLASLIVWVGLALGSDMAQAWQIAHVLQAIVWSSVALPVYVLARFAGLPRPAALLTALAAVFVPFAVVSTAFLNTAASYVCVPLAVLAIASATIRRSARGDVLALAALGLAATARANLVLLAPVLIISIVVHEWRSRPPGAPLRALPGRMLRAHVIVWAAVAAAVLYVAVRGVHTLGGEYPTDLHFPVGALWERARTVVAQLALGVGVVPFAVGVPWLVVQAFRPRTPRTGALGVAAFAGSILLVYSTYVGGIEERYMAPLVPLVLVGFAAAIVRREVSWIATGVGTAATLACIANVGRVDDIGAYGWFASPARQFYTKVVLGRLSSLPTNLDAHPVVLAVLIGAVVTAALVAATRRRGRRAVAVQALIVAGVLGYAVAATAHDSGKFVAEAGLPDVSWQQVTWIDRALPRGQYAAVLDNGDTANLYTWLQVTMWNRSVKSTLAFYSLFSFTLPQSTVGLSNVSVDDRTGRLTSGPSRLPPYVVTAPMFVPYGLDTRPVAHSPYGPTPVRLERVVARRYATYVAANFDNDGYIEKGHGLPRVLVFGRGLVSSGPQCLAMVLRNPPDPRARHPYAIGQRGGPVVRGVLTGPGAVREVSVPLPGLRAGAAQKRAILVRTRGSSRAPNGRRVTFAVSELRVSRCAAPAHG